MIKTRMFFETRTRKRWRLLLAAGIAAVAWFAFKPSDTADGIEHLDKVQHVVAFASLAFAASFGWEPKARTSLLTAAGLLGYGLLIELVQTQLPTRSGEVADWLADAVGVALGMLLARELRRRT